MSMPSANSNPTASILVTGASGFVGSALVKRLRMENRQVFAGMRGTASTMNARVIPDLSSAANWTSSLKDIDIVVHTAARVHIMNDTADNPLTAFRETNVEGTLALARQAASVGVRRFIFLSSIKVNGEMTEHKHAFSEVDVPAPVDAYGISKAEAETGLRQIADETGMQVVMIRPPLVYGPGVKANFQSMMRWLQRGVPLPLGNIKNMRSLIALENLVDLITLCIEHPAAANRVFLASDGEDMSTSDLLRRTASAMGVRANLIPVPTPILIGMARLLGKPAVAQRLCSSLQIDISAARGLLGWRPPLTADEGLRQTAQWFLSK